MDALMDVLAKAMIVVAGLTLRLLFAVAILAAVAAPILAVMVVIRRAGLLRDRLRGFAHIGWLTWQRALQYAPGHTWLRSETAERLRVGLDDLAQRLIPAGATLRLAPVGATLRRGDMLADISWNGRHARVLSPADGVVLRANERVERHPRLLHHDPYGRGWLAELRPLAVVGGLRAGDEARHWLVHEERRLDHALEHHLGIAAADGGEMTAPATTLLEPDAWQEIAHEFFERADAE
jgi:glycine cleavage system H lipoate-binding protein